MGQEHDDYADGPIRGRPWTLGQVVILGAVVCLTLLLIACAAETVWFIYPDIKFVHD